MSSRSSSSAGDSLEDLTVRDWPLRQKPIESTTVLGLVLSFAVSVAWGSGSWWTGAICAGVLLLTVWRVWLPVTYEIGPRGVTQVILGRRRRLSWRSIGCIRVVRNGLVLYRAPAPAPLAALHSIFLPFQDQQRAILERVQRHVSTE